MLRRTQDFSVDWFAGADPGIVKTRGPGANLGKGPGILSRPEAEAKCYNRQFLTFSCRLCGI